MSKFTFLPEHFILSETGVLRQLESADCKEATIRDVDKIPRDREYIVMVPKDVEVSKEFLRCTPDNVVFVIDDGLYRPYSSASDKNVKATWSRKCFFIRDGFYRAFTDSRLPGLDLMNIFYDPLREIWRSDHLTLKEYFAKVMPKSSLESQPVAEHTDWNKCFESAFNAGLERRKKRVAEYLTKAVQVIPNMIENGKREQDFSCIPDDILEELNKQSPTNVKWVKNETGNVLLTITL